MEWLGAQSHSPQRVVWYGRFNLCASVTWSSGEGTWAALALWGVWTGAQPDGAQQLGPPRCAMDEVEEYACSLWPISHLSNY